MGQTIKSPRIMRGQTFYIGMAITLALTAIGGFGSFALRGMVDIGRAPYWVHVHGAMFVAWTLLFVVQTILGQSGARVIHRRLGWAAVGLGVAMVPLGAITAAMAVRLDRVPPFFPRTIFVALNILELLAFMVLLFAAIRMRRRTDWHKRLMVGAMVAIIGPAFGRILPMPLLGSAAGPSVMACQMLFVIALAIHDRVNHRHVHPATIATGVVILIEGLAVPLLAATGPIVTLTRMLAE